MLKSRAVAGGPAGIKIVACIMTAALAGAPLSTAWAQTASAPAAEPAAPAPAPNLPADLAAAKKHYAEGEKKFKANDFAGALVEFRAANDVKCTPQAERYLGLCEDALGHYPEAADWYDKFLTHVPEKLAAAGRRGAKARRPRSRRCPARSTSSRTRRAPTWPSTTRRSPRRRRSTSSSRPARTRSRCSRQGHLPAEKVDRRALRVDAGRVRRARDGAAAAPAAASGRGRPPARRAVDASAARRAGSRTASCPAFITGGLAIAAAGVGTVFGVLALNDKSKFDKNPTTESPPTTATPTRSSPTWRSAWP